MSLPRSSLNDGNDKEPQISSLQVKYGKLYGSVLLCLLVISGCTHFIIASFKDIKIMEDFRLGNQSTKGRLLGEFNQSEEIAVAPGFFIFGDSTVDCGNNNYLLTFARANIPPYGRDFVNRTATGRFSNGLLSIDYLASFMGLPFVPAALGVCDIEAMKYGLNYASAGAGILLQTGSDLGQHISLDEQLGLFSGSEAKMALLFGKPVFERKISKSIFYISIGNNDFIHYYLRNVSGILEKQSPLGFSNMILEKLSNHMKIIVGGGVKKVVFVGIGPLGCAPSFLSIYNESSKPCISEINDMVQHYNLGLKSLTREINQEFPQAKAIFCDIYKGFYDIIVNAKSLGFERTDVACCGAGRNGALVSCFLPDMACGDASSYVFWDAFHPTEKVNMITALSIWNGTTCSPFNLHMLFQL